MELVQGVDALPIHRGPAAVTVGFFDGVHRGHQAVLRRTVDVASERGLVPVAVTFDRHPREIITPGQEPKLITTLERKAGLIAELGIEFLVVLEFTEEFSRWPPEEFISGVLAKGLSAAHVVIGSNFTFGHKAMGNLAVLADLGPSHGFSVEGVALLRLGDRRVSSSSVREALAAGDLSWPTVAMGRRFVLDGRVTRGAGRGTTLGYPTANLETSARMQLPGEGVYAGRAFAHDGWHIAAINVGTNPTFGGEPVHVEAFLLDFEGDLQDDPIAVEFWERLRDEERFESPEALARQISQDVERTRTLIAPSE
jgi:riboflavin kinase/FMN adenylyltransferase